MFIYFCHTAIHAHNSANLNTFSTHSQTRIHKILCKFMIIFVNLIMDKTATHCNTLQNTATHCNTLQHTAAHRSPLYIFLIIFVNSCYRKLLCANVHEDTRRISCFVTSEKGGGVVQGQTRPVIMMGMGECPMNSSGCICGFTNVFVILMHFWFHRYICDFGVSALTNVYVPQNICVI